MLSNKTLELLDDLDNMTKGFLSELSEMETKRRGPSSKKVIADKTGKIKPGTVAVLDSSMTEAANCTGDEEYRMNHPRRGKCLIFAYSEFQNLQYQPFLSVETNSKNCVQAFEGLKFEVQEFRNLKTKDLKVELEKVSAMDHSDCDSLVVVYMSHGTVVNGCEKLVTIDGMVDTAELWSRVAQCPSLLGKPKLFFIDVCRGGGIEKGLAVCTDTSSFPQKLLVNDGLAFDSPDILVMMSTFEGMRAYTDPYCSTFILFLTNTLKAIEGKNDLSEILLQVTRNMELNFEANAGNENEDFHKARQLPQTKSTLTKRILLSKA